MPEYFWEAAFRSSISTYYPPRADFVSRNSTFSSWVLVAPESGHFEWKTENAKSEVISGEATFGEFVCVAPNRLFERRAISRLSYHVLQWQFYSDRSGSEPLSKVLWPPGKSAIRDLPHLKSVFEKLRELPGKTDGWSTRRRAHLLEELLHLAWQTGNEPRTTDPDMQTAAQLLHQHAGEPFSMSEVSREFGLGPVQFTRRFRAAHGKNPIEFLTQIRLENAQRLLIETSLPLDEIAFRCGWSSGAYFVSVFKKQFQTTPGTFRKQHRV